MSRSIGKSFLVSCALAAATFVPAVHAQTVSVLAGQGGSDAEGVPASTAKMKGGSTSVTAPDGTLYFTEQDFSNARARKITSDGRVYTIASGLSYPSGIARDASGNVYVSDSGNGRILKISAAGVISTFAGNTGLNCSGTLGDGGQAINAGFCWNSWMTFDASGNLYVSDEINNRVRKISTTGVITTVAGSGPVNGGWTEPSYSGDGGPATAARLNGPQGLAFDAAGNLYVADLGNHRIRMVTPGGIISTIAGSGPTGFSGGGGYAGDGGNALSARLNRPQGLAMDAVGNLYIADNYNRRVRKIDTTGKISTIAGNGTNGYPVEGAVATSTPVPPWSVSVDSVGNLYVDADTDTPRLVKVGLVGDLIVDDGVNSARSVARNDLTGNWSSLSQTFTARWSRVTFGFRLFNWNTNTGVLLPDAGKPVVMNLYSGENSYSTLLASRTVAIPAQLSDSPRRIWGDVGFLMADFSDVALTVGGKYTVEITLPPADLPASGQASNLHVWTSMNNPYPDGRFYFRCCYDNSSSGSQDMMFRMTEVVVSGPVAQAEAVEQEIVEALDDGDISAFVAKYLLGDLEPIQANLAWMAANPTSPDLDTIRGRTCTLINSFNTLLERFYRDRRLPRSYRDAWKADMLEVKAQIGCRW